MEMQSKKLADMLKRISVCGIIKECVLIATKEGTSCVAVDMTSAMYTHINSSVSFGIDQQLGIADIATLIKYLDNPAHEKVDTVVMDNRLVFSANNANFRYLLGKPDTIGTVPADIPEDGSDFNDVLNIPYSLMLTDAAKSQYMDMAKLVKPPFVTLNMGAKGRVVLEAGTETSNKFDMVLGQSEDAAANPPASPISVRVVGDFLTNILATVAGSEEPTVLRLDADVMAIIQGTDFWVLNHTQDI